MLINAVRSTKADAVRRAMEEAGGKYAEAAKLLGVHVNSLHRMIQNLGLKQVPPGHR